MDVKNAHTYDIQTKGTPTNTGGAIDETWTTSTTGAKGYFEFLSGKQKMVGKVEYFIDFRLYDFNSQNVTTANRVVYDGQTYKVVAVDKLTVGKKHDEIYLVDINNDSQQKRD